MLSLSQKCCYIYWCKEIKEIRLDSPLVTIGTLRGGGRGVEWVAGSFGRLSLSWAHTCSAATGGSSVSSPLLLEPPASSFSSVSLAWSAVLLALQCAQSGIILSVGLRERNNYKEKWEEHWPSISYHLHNLLLANPACKQVYKQQVNKCTNSSKYHRDMWLCDVHLLKAPKLTKLTYVCACVLCHWMFIGDSLRTEIPSHQVGVIVIKCDLPSFMSTCERLLLHKSLWLLYNATKQHGSVLHKGLSL